MKIKSYGYTVIFFALLLVPNSSRIFEQTLSESQKAASADKMKNSLSVNMKIIRNMLEFRIEAESRVG